MTALGEAIDDGVLDLQGTVLGIANGGVGTGKVHRDGGGTGEVIFPGNGMGPEVEVQIVVHLELGEHKHDSGGKAAPQTGLVADGQFALEVDAGHGLTDLLCTQIGQLDGQQVFQPFGAGCKKFFHHAHGDAIKIVPHYTLSARARHSNLGQRRHINGKRRGKRSPPPCGRQDPALGWQLSTITFVKNSKILPGPGRKWS